MNKRDSAYRALGENLARYADGLISFNEMEASLGDLLQTAPAEGDTIRRIYHILNHYEIDEVLRTKDVDYARSMKRKLLAISGALLSNSSSGVEQTIENVWR